MEEIMHDLPPAPDLVTLQVPGNLPPNISELADEMTDREMRAMIIVQTHLIQELVAMARDAHEAMAKFMAAGPMGMFKNKNPAKSGNPAVRAGFPGQQAQQFDMTAMRAKAEELGIKIP